MGNEEWVERGLLALAQDVIEIKTRLAALEAKAAPAPEPDDITDDLQELINAGWLLLEHVRLLAAYAPASKQNQFADIEGRYLKAIEPFDF